jgi:hypothetical protein
MKAGSLQRMTTPLLCERVERRHPQEKCASKSVRGIVLSAFIYFLTQMDLRLEINLKSLVRDLKSEFHLACVAEQQKHLTVNQASNDFVGASPTTCTRNLLGM